MPTYQYTAKDTAGQTRTGVLEAETNSVAVAQLRDQGLWVTQLQARGSSTAAAPAPAGPRPSLIEPLWSGVSLRDLAFFFRQFATLIDSGVPLFQGLSSLALQAPNQKLRRIIADVAYQ